MRPLALAFMSCGHNPIVETPAFDWVGIIGNGQSLSVGAVSGGTLSDTQPYNNIGLKDSEASNQYPLDGVGAIYSTVPFQSRYRVGTVSPVTGQYPVNILGETPQPGMANQITAMHFARTGADYITAHSITGATGLALVNINKAGGGFAYPGGIQEAVAFKALATAAGKSYGVAAIVLTHGESDASNVAYRAGLKTLIDDYNTDLKAITGQSQDVLMIASQQSTTTGMSHVYLWQASQDTSRILVSGPKYQWTTADGTHLLAANYRALGEKYGQVYDTAITQGKTWKPLQPNAISRSGAVITITFDVPVAPLQWSSTVDSPHQADAYTATMGNGRGFEVVGQTINSVAILGNNRVTITLSADPGAVALTVQYAITPDTTGSYGHMRGQLMDSDPFVGLASLQAMPNYCVHFAVTTNTSGVWP